MNRFYVLKRIAPLKIDTVCGAPRHQSSKGGPLGRQPVHPLPVWLWPMSAGYGSEPDRRVYTQQG